MDAELKTIIIGAILSTILYVDAINLNLIPRSCAAAVLLLYWLRFMRLMELEGAAEADGAPKEALEREESEGEQSKDDDEEDKEDDDKDSWWEEDPVRVFDIDDRLEKNGEADEWVNLEDDEANDEEMIGDGRVGQDEDEDSEDSDLLFFFF